jgi:hypothetical protein
MSSLDNPMLQIPNYAAYNFLRGRAALYLHFSNKDFSILPDPKKCNLQIIHFAESKCRRISLKLLLEPQNILLIILDGRYTQQIAITSVRSWRV